MSLCRVCGNEVDDPSNCPVCLAGRAPHKGSADAQSGTACLCPRCADPLGQQDWEGTTTLTCPTCSGTFFPDGSLEVVLNKLRATCDPVDVASAVQDFKDRFTRQLPEAVRYKSCPVCGTTMTRLNYATVSGVIVDNCPDHGTWVDETAFAALADFICRGGDAVASKAGKVRARLDANQPGRTSSLFDRFFGKDD